MSVVQTEYPNYHDGMVDGQVANTTTYDVDSAILNHATVNVPFGRYVRTATAAGANARDVELGVAAGAGRGIAIMDERLPGASAGEYTNGDPVSVLWRGDVAVRVSAAVTGGSNVVVATVQTGADATLETVGQLSTKAANATHLLLAGARFMTTAAAQEIAVVRLAGSVPAA